MARKTLLNEREIRKFLKLANITTVGDDKIQEMGGAMAYNRDDDMDADADLGDAEADVEAADDLDADAEIDLDDLGGDDEPGHSDLDVGDGAQLDADVAEDIFADVANAVAQALGIEDRVDIEAGDAAGAEGGDEMELAPAAEPPAPDLDAEPEPAPELDAAADDEDPAELSEDEPFELSEDDFEDSIVNEVSRRVIDRLNKENRKTKMVDELAERIMNRLANNKSS